VLRGHSLRGGLLPLVGIPMHLGGFHGGKRNATCRGRNHDVKEAEFGFPCFFRRGTGENTELGDILGAFLVPSSALHRSWGPRSAILLATSPRPDSTRGRGSNGNSRSPPFSLFRFCPRFRHGCPDARSRGACSRPGAATSRAIARSGARMHTSGSAPGPSGVAEVSPPHARPPYCEVLPGRASHRGAPRKPSRPRRRPGPGPWPACRPPGGGVPTAHDVPRQRRQGHVPRRPSWAGSASCRERAVWRPQ